MHEVDASTYGFILDSEETPQAQVLRPTFNVGDSYGQTIGTLRVRGIKHWRIRVERNVERSLLTNVSSRNLNWPQMRNRLLYISLSILLLVFCLM